MLLFGEAMLLMFPRLASSVFPSQGPGEAAQHFLYQYCQALQLHRKDLGNPLYKKDFFFL